MPSLEPGFFLARVVNPIVVRLGLTPTLTVAGRRTGAPRTIPFGGPFEWRGARYLVSGRGDTDWARNLRVAGGAHLRTGQKDEVIAVTELRGHDRDEVLAAYRDKMGNAVRRYFERIPDPAGHPVFRIETS